MIRLRPAAFVLAAALSGVACVALVSAQTSDSGNRNGSGPAGAKAQEPIRGPSEPGARAPVSVAVGKAQRKAMPVRIDSIGIVQTVASVTLRSRVDSQITEVLFEDGAFVRAGDVLFKLDARQIEAQIKQAEANLARDRASLTYAASDLKRQETLAKRDFASEQKLDTARTQVATLEAAVAAGEAAVENLKVQGSYYTVTAPISGRVGAAGLKVGNVAKTGEAATPLAVINQTSPIYVAFALTQRRLPEIREAMQAGTASVLATPQGYGKGAEGKIAFIDNTVDATTGTITVRGIFENADEFLWPGTLCNVRLTLRMEPDAVAVPREAVQTSQTGDFVFVVENGSARVNPVSVDRTVDGEAVIATGLRGDETVVTDGHLLLTDGARVAPRSAPAAPAPGVPQPAQPEGGSISRRGSAS
ncbi:efflux RND transporter periplasmic adaptor subunit [Chelatococcus sp. SYSU_G07232]|uniref:Efflux RND transporter periplasmic adaptor subunit n=1 Tax=Chelatococcus albus TaxID=3047466 RepID=A0ABT7ALW1_9HYPH|nr:efflux RND transporter periplasmic adaptor subunit [Chelatococcus sp. SYSU_G07232]MDJ1159937.1 efflux RND transporter periplasmic adaptor subunit [Chelatococcus sp. SYSU_G07232]